MIEKMHGMEGSEKQPQPEPGPDAPIDMDALAKKFDVSGDADPRPGRRLLDNISYDEAMARTYGAERAAEIGAQPAPEAAPRIPRSELFLRTDAPTAPPESTQELPATEFNARESLARRLMDASASGGTDNEAMLQALRDIRNDASLSPEERKSREQETTAVWNSYVSDLEERGLRPS